MTQPKIASRRKVTSACDQLCCPTSSISTKRSARNIAKGSLVPDSTSRTARTRGRRRRPRALIRKKAGRSVGGAHHRPNQQRLNPADAKNEFCHRGGQQ